MDFCRGNSSVRSHLSTTTYDECSVEAHRERGTQRCKRFANPARRRADDDANDRGDEHLDDGEGNLQSTGQRHHGAHPVTCLQHLSISILTTSRERIAVARFSTRHHEHSRSTQVHSPTQVEVLAVEANFAWIATDFAEEIAAHHDTRRRQDEDVADRVVLFLVSLARLDRRTHVTDAICAESDGLHDRRIVPLHELWPDHPCIRAKRLFDQPRDRIGGERDVVVHQAEEPTISLNETRDLVHERTEARVSCHSPNDRAG